MYALKEDLIRVVENLTVLRESTDTIVKLKTKIENSSTFESDPDFVKILIQNCIDERVSRNEREILLWSPWKYRCGQRTVRLAVVACSQKQNICAQAQLMRTETVETFELVKVKQNFWTLEQRKREKGERREQA
ncbi:hypothetical protein TNCV_3164851 [Trichonephila clavipes]|nr:hypothetical protein TNCV_3164851 [Trichonephila clavipes]